jgi:hypothetical protein
VRRVSTEYDAIVAESLSRVTTERDDALRRAKVLTKKLEVLEKESQAALDKAKTEAQECEKKRRSDAAVREDGLEGRLRALAEKLSGDILCHNFFALNTGLRKLSFLPYFLRCSRGSPEPHRPNPRRLPDGRRRHSRGVRYPGAGAAGQAEGRVGEIPREHPSRGRCSTSP